MQARADKFSYSSSSLDRFTRFFLLGLPTQIGTIDGRPGCEEAPQRLREMSLFGSLWKDGLYDACTGQMVLPPSTLVDVGDLLYSPGRGRSVYFSEISQLSETISDSRKTLIAVGGDHLLTLPLVEGFAQSRSKFQILHLDAHRDMSKMSEANVRATHADFVSYLAELPQVERVVQYGIRGYTSSFVSHPKVFSYSSQARPQDVVGALNANIPVYVSIDLDVLDPSVFSSVNFPVADGLLPAQLIELFREMKVLDVLGIDFMEYNALLDETRKDASLLVDLLVQFMVVRFEYEKLLDK